MAKRVIERIDGILKNINKVQNELEGVSFAKFKEQYILQDAISFYIVQVGERMNRLEELLSFKYPDLPWKESRKIRNIIVHNYDCADYEIIYNTAINDLPVLKLNLQKIKDDIIGTKTKIIETFRLFLRPWDDFDAEDLFEIAKDSEIGSLCGWRPHNHIRDSFFMLHNFLEMEGTYAICLKDNERIIGSISLSSESKFLSERNEYELSFWIGKQFWNNGYATEAANKIIEYAFNKLNASKIISFYYEPNEKAHHLMDKLGFKFNYERQNANPYELETNKTVKVFVFYLED